MGKYWNEEIECMAHEDMKKLQSERLVKQVKHVWDCHTTRSLWKKRA